MTAVQPRAASETRIGVIMLKTAFPRPCGDIGNAETFGGQGLFETVEAATIARVIDGDPRGSNLIQGFLVARDRLVARGAGLVTTSCGVLALHQERLQQGCPVPVVASSLFQLPVRDAEFGPQGQIGVMCMDSCSIGPAHLLATGARADTPLIGLEDGLEIYPVLRRNRADVPLDPARAEADVISAGRRMVEMHPNIAAIVLECTNLPPYRAALSHSLGLPVYDILTWIDEVWRNTGGAGNRSGKREET